jgi:homoserine O-succinyltransferase/O-acetyltransferase
MRVDRSRSARGRLTIGVVNLMPAAQEYEPVLRACFDLAAPTELCWIRLESKAYSGSNREDVLVRYETYSRLRARTNLDGLIVTGAPVDRLPFIDVRYWPELRQVLEDAHQTTASVLGICWGALALGYYQGIEPRVYEQKLFGVFAAQQRRSHPLTRCFARRSLCPHSRNAGLDSEALARLERAGLLRILVDSEEVGPVLIVSADDRLVMHLGHPEYPDMRLREEFERDCRVGPARPPHGYDLEQPRNVWRADTLHFFSAWIDLLQQSSVRRRT